jgi:hypothetical protein
MSRPSLSGNQCARIQNHPNMTRKDIAGPKNRRAASVRRLPVSVLFTGCESAAFSLGKFLP